MEEDDDDNEILDCPNCGTTYDDADADFLICSKCGFDAEDETIDARRIDRSMKGYGIDPDVTAFINKSL